MNIKDIDEKIAELSANTSPESQFRLRMLLRMKANTRLLQKIENLKAEKPGLKLILQKKDTEVYVITFNGESGWWVDALSRDYGKVDSIKDLVNTGGSWIKPLRDFDPYILGLIADI